MNDSWYYGTFLYCGTSWYCDTSWYYGTLDLPIYLYNYTRPRLRPCLPNNATRHKYPIVPFWCKDATNLKHPYTFSEKKRPSCLSQKSQIQKYSGNWPDMHKPKDPCCTKVFCVNTRYSTEKKVALRQIEYKHLDVCFLPFHIVGHVLHEA